MNSFIYIIPLIVTLMCFNPTTNGENVPDPSCPVYTENDTAEIVPDLSDCTRFFICDAGRIKRAFECPCGLLFNSTLKVCDWPDNVNCTQPPRSCVVPTTTSTTTAAPIVEPQAQSIPTELESSIQIVPEDIVTLPAIGIDLVPSTQQGIVEEIPPQ